MIHPVIDVIFSLEHKREELRTRKDDVYEQMHALEEAATCSVECRYEETKDKTLSNAGKRRRAADELLEKSSTYQDLREEYRDVSGAVRRMGFEIDREKRRFAFDCADRSGGIIEC